MFTEAILDDIQDALSLLELVESKGMEVKKTGKDYQCLCPFHGDKDSPSFSIGEKVGHCFGCGWKGNIFQFLCDIDSISFVEAVRACASQKKIDISSVDLYEKQLEHEAENLLDKVITASIEYWKKQLRKNKRAVAYLKGRGITAATIKEFDIGYDDGKLIGHLVGDKGFKKADLKSIGLLNKHGNSRMMGRVIVPIKHRGRWVNVYGRAIGDANIKHLYLKNNECAYGQDDVKGVGEVKVVEACFDRLVMISKGHRDVIAQLGTQGFRDHHIARMIKDGTKKFCLVPDHDKPKPGRAFPESFAAAANTAERILNQGADCDILLIPKVGQDPAEYFNSGSTKLEQYEPVKWSKVKCPGLDRLVAQRLSPLGASASEHRELCLSIAGMRWELTKTTQSGTAFKGLLNITKASKIVFKDSLSLWSASKRALVAKATGMDQGMVDKICSLMEKQWDKLGELDAAYRKQKSKNKKTGLPGYAVKLAEDLQKSPTLIADIEDDITSMGYVGEGANKTLLYLIGASCMLEEPLGAYIASESSAGKSAMVEAVTKLFPPELVYMISRMTPQALYYIEEDELKNRWLLIAERQGVVGDENADYNLRTFFSEKELTLMVPEKDEQGTIRTRKHKVNGPIAYTETTTDLGVHDENATRLIELNIREDEKQTRDVHNFQKARAARSRGEASKHEKNIRKIILRHRAFLSSLKPMDVVVPFAEHIRFPTHLTRARRDLLKFLGIIKVVAFLHQHQREVKKSDGVSYIEATVEDYKTAYDLSKMSIRKAFSAIPERATELLGQIIDVLADSKTGQVDIDDDELCVFTIKDIREAGVKKAPATIKKYMVPLIDQDIVEAIEEGGRGRGRAARYKLKVSNLNEAIDQSGDDVLKPDELKGIIASGGDDDEFSWDD